MDGAPRPPADYVVTVTGVGTLPELTGRPGTSRCDRCGASVAVSINGPAGWRDYLTCGCRLERIEPPADERDDLVRAGRGAIDRALADTADHAAA